MSAKAKQKTRAERSEAYELAREAWHLSEVAVCKAERALRKAQETQVAAYKRQNDAFRAWLGVEPAEPKALPAKGETGLPLLPAKGETGCDR
jgi:hypothetical protein